MRIEEVLCINENINYLHVQGWKGGILSDFSTQLLFNEISRNNLDGQKGVVYKYSPIDNSSIGYLYLSDPFQVK